MVYWANNLALKIVLNMYLSNTHSKRSVNMIFYKGLRCIRRNVFLAHREFFKMKPPPPFHLLIRLEIETIK